MSSVQDPGLPKTPAAWSRGSGAPTIVGGHGVTHHHVSSSASAVRSADMRPFGEMPPAWFGDAVTRLLDLTEAGVRFDGGAFATALELLGSPIWSGVPRPLVSSAEGGGISLEFRGVSAELQIELESDGRASAYAAAGGLEWEGPFEELPDGVEKWAWRLTQDRH